MRRAPNLRIVERGHRVAVRPRILPLLLPVYFPGESHRCPACQGRAWHVGRTVAECANTACGMALPIAEGSQR
jgi:hypothetical protein